MSVKAFYHLKGSYYGEVVLDKTRNVDEIAIGLYYKDGSTDGEIVVKWTKEGNKVVSRMEIFDDVSKDVKSSCSDFISYFKSKNGEMTPEESVKLLLELGYKDFTKKKRPENWSR